MCGIVGYIGNRDASAVLLKGLQRMEYRGYDSAGIAVVNGDLDVRKKLGKVEVLVRELDGNKVSGNLGIGHTRWATHGVPSDVNAHPHTSSDGKFALVHNGIIENYAAIREKLQQNGHTFESQTDTEVLVRLIEDIHNKNDQSLVESVQEALRHIVGAYGIALVSSDEPDLLIAARNGSPLILGVGENEYFLGSDAAPIIEYTRDVIYLNDGEMAVIRRWGYEVLSVDNVVQHKEINHLDWDLQEIEKGGYPHFMLKEIFEQPKSIENAMRGRIDASNQHVRLGGLTPHLEMLKSADRIIICACGTSWHAALVGEYMIEGIARIPVEVEYASEFRYRNPILRKGDVVFVISQSGETADTLAAVREAQSQGIPVFAICNTVGSTIARESDAGIYLHAGPEIGVASTKAFTGQVTVLAMLAVKLGQGGALSADETNTYLKELKAIPGKVEEVLKKSDEIKSIGQEYSYMSNFLYLGRGPNFPVALEGALKLKEISYIHAEGYPAAEMKHGPIALIDQFMPVVFIANKDSSYDKVLSNIEEVVAREGVVIAVTDNEDPELDRLCKHVIRIPSTLEYLSPLLTVIPLQLLSYHIALLRGCDVDQPRNLAKSVTVE
ncbi:MAG: glutamine--fructose-6-phosphate transaminase (isomerizing) [Bacteroidetes bacterium]|nr:MAG: glutamine--fructose-6-phosphate transaminase (isomerizing) [Bacteroidota bacterium]